MLARCAWVDKQRCGKRDAVEPAYPVLSVSLNTEASDTVFCRSLCTRSVLPALTPQIRRQAQRSHRIPEARMRFAMRVTGALHGELHANGLVPARLSSGKLAEPVCRPVPPPPNPEGLFSVAVHCACLATTGQALASLTGHGCTMCSVFGRVFRQFPVAFTRAGRLTDG